MKGIPPAPLVRLTTEAIYFYMNLLDNTPIIVLDEQGQVESCNPAFRRLAGYTDRELFAATADFVFESKSFQHLVHEGFGHDVQQRYRKDGDTLAVLNVRHSDGAWLDVPTLLVKALTEEGPRNLLILYPSDTDRQPNLLERLGETMLGDEDNGVILLRSDFTIVDISGLASQVLGVEGERVLGQPVERYFEHARKEYELITSTFEHGSAIRSHPLTWHQGDQRKELLMDVGLLRNSQGLTEGAYILFKDVTNLRSLERQLQRSDRLSMIGQIAAGAAHEIRNPLTAIRGFLQMFRKTLTDRGMEKEVGYTEIMLTELDRINNLVGEFLLLSKPKMVMYDNVDVAAVMHDLLPMISSEALLYNVVVNWEMEEKLSPVLADREMLKQVLLNISKNGIEAMTTGGTLTIRCREERATNDRRIIIEVQDTGPGIAPAMLERIFDPFVTTKPSGTGLGLSVCQRIIHEFGGTISAFSRATGARFVIALPCLM
ncbi:PAS domain S-box-containing protein [Paenibacillus phyllosphaerae]|uniref:histidine kinase n=1 Tax=Paenibacillus phyllosphaerae TaxID=274593 RepID=A0A7W5B5H8_9BACL|nr:ATP-binding protein [Paenibacillus phyllosphaerae]MBB3114647.1 PAS domain S-box-containing protein [Paenibacillus phyllosphaerae]